MKKELSVVMHKCLMLDVIPMFLFVFIGIHTTVYLYSHIVVDNKAISDCVYALISLLALQITCNSTMIMRIVKYIKVLICLNAVMIVSSAALLKQRPEIVVILIALNTGTFMNITKIGFAELINKQFRGTDRTIFGSRNMQLFALMSGIASMTILIVPKLEIEAVVYIQLVYVVLMVVADMSKAHILKKNIEKGS